VAPSDASARVKASADLVCDGDHDEAKLLASITQAAHRNVRIDDRGTSRTVECYARHSVEWLAGQYNLNAPLVLPDCTDVVIQAEGATLTYTPSSGDAMVLRGLERCRFYLGTIRSYSSGATLCVRPTAAMASRHSTLNYTGLQSLSSALRFIDLHENIVLRQSRPWDMPNQVNPETGKVVFGNRFLSNADPSGIALGVSRSDHHWRLPGRWVCLSHSSSERLKPFPEPCECFVIGELNLSGLQLELDFD
jgi:hypothetical protein